ncbi:MAG: NTP transferase domain-containing protein [Clostridiaceae bacterium]|nr:NTP transferase domain-containing protein [Clostridiaceae bacterium]
MIIKNGIKPVTCIILCAGRGTRMQSKDTHKVCFPIGGKPAILHSMERYKAAGLTRFTVVVGTMAEQVMSVISSTYDGINYAFQKEALGTGNAARIGFESIEAYDPQGAIMVTMGDKIIEHRVIERLMSEFYENDLDLAFVAGPREFNPAGGHVVIDDGKVCGIVESLDIEKAKLYNRILNQLQTGAYRDIDPRENIKEISKNIISSERKREKIIKQLENIMEQICNGETEKAILLLKENAAIKLGGRTYEPGFLEKAQYVNSAIYIFKTDAFKFGLSKMTTQNADREEYLTEAINSICSSREYKTSVIVVKEQESILTYNNVVELLQVEEILTGSKDQLSLKKSEYKPVDEWIALFKEMPDSLHNILTDIYGDNPERIEERRAEYIKVLEHFRKRYGANKKVVITRAPGRINLMGRHVEHRGGNVNVISIDKEVICVASPNPAQVNVTNVSSDYEEGKFSIEEYFKNVNWDNWLGYLESSEISKKILEKQGDWLNYVKAPIIRLQYLYKDRKLTGMDMAFNGNIPVAAGLSSSSAIVVATAEAAVALNNLDVKPQKFVDLCGEGEWFVGSRGGAGDHAAIKFGQRGYIATLGFFPFRYKGSFEFPKGYKLLIANSFVKANKTTNARDLFNQRVASYEFGFMMFKDKFPEYKDKVRHIRDINPENLGVTPSKIYSMLLEIPEKIPSDKISSIISPEYANDIKRIMKTHKVPKEYEIRSVLMYGIAECRRSFIFGKLMEKGDLEGVGRMMKISHDGDRVARLDENNKMQKYEYDLSDDVLKSLIDDLKSEDVSRVYSAQIENQPGGYACSTPEIDFIVDTVNRIDGVLGAQLSGAGLGGCVMILAKDEAVEKIVSTLKKCYYEPGDFDDGITISIPVKGSGLIGI